MNEEGRPFGITWTEQNAPRGNSHALSRAKEELKPFDPHHRDDLLYLCSCEKCVEKFIVDIAIAYNERVLRIERAPRLKTVHENLTLVAKAARSLADELIALDDYSREHLIVLDRFDQCTILAYQYEAAAASRLPKPRSAEMDSDGDLVKDLLALERYIASRLRDVAGWNASDAIDKGGNTNVMKQKLGPPAAYLINCCWYAFENCRPGEATSSENGPFVKFLNSVHEFATGKIEENTTLLNWTKKLAKPMRRHDVLVQDFFKLENELERLRSEPESELSNAQIAKLEAEIERAKTTLFEALREINPTNPRFRQQTARATPR